MLIYTSLAVEDKRMTPAPADSTGGKGQASLSGTMIKPENND
jgi:hypothetical protein